MKKINLFSTFTLATILGLFGCSESSPINTQEPMCNGDACLTPPDDTCQTECKSGETCVDGVCKCGNEICDMNETCQNDQCKLNDAPCDGDECQTEPAEDPCEACASGESCINGECKCGNETCAMEEECIAGKCQQAPQDTTDPEAEDSENDGDSEDSGDSEDGDSEDTEICDPPCAENEICNEAECVPQIEYKACAPECNDETHYCDPSGTCQPYPDEQAHECPDDAEWQNGACVCGSQTCNDDQICKAGTCINLDPCKIVSCGDGQICVNGECKATMVSFNETDIDVMFSSESKKLVATKQSDGALKWTVNGKSSLSGLRCKRVKNNEYVEGQYVSKLSDCIKIDETKHTETIQFLGFTRHLNQNVIVEATNGASTATANLTLKPYFDMNSFVKVTRFETEDNQAFSGIVYKNGYCAGHKLHDDSDYLKHPECSGNYCSISDFHAGKEKCIEAYQKCTNLKANLAGKGNPYALTQLNDDDIHVIDHDMYTKYIQPLMLKDGNSYYGTRASVVAAARFLILQFPYDIPYQMKGLDFTGSARSHYVWAYNTKTINGARLADVAVYGLNLNKYEYSSLTDHSAKRTIRNDVIPWGAKYNLIQTDKTKKETDYPYNGLECSGFVTWAFRNGHLGLGDWKTELFGNCYRNKTTNETKCPGKRNYKDINYVNKLNQYNSLNAAYTKLNKLKDSDFVQLNACPDKPKLDCTQKDDRLTYLKDVFKDAKAGDLLWRGNYVKGNKSHYRNGHVAMIIGIKRNKGEVTHIYVGEAVSKSGNRLAQWSINKFNTDSLWATSTTQASFLIKMDRVYNYYSEPEKNHNFDIKDDDIAGCPNKTSTLAKGGNCYKYTDMYNENFNAAIKNMTW
ncbi:MAG: hypothetical protein IKY83_09530 [Proteobacteria bacterium]|nr:hypothetical protein [Pseudomonadota bacterium]